MENSYSVENNLHVARLQYDLDISDLTKVLIGSSLLFFFSLKNHKLCIENPLKL